MVKKKKLEKNSGYVIIPYHVFECVNNQLYYMMFGEAEADVLKSNHKVYVSDKFDLTTDGSMSEVPFRSVPLRNNHDTLMSYGEDF